MTNTNRPQDTAQEVAERMAIEALVEAWDLDVLHDEIDEIEMAETLIDQTDGTRQGWDMSAEDAEDHPDIALMIGLQIDPYTEVEDPTDEEMAEADRLWEAWGRVVGEAARRWLADHPVWAVVARIRQEMFGLVRRDADAVANGWDPYAYPENGHIWQEAERQLLAASGDEELDDDTYADLVDAVAGILPDPDEIEDMDDEEE